MTLPQQTKVEETDKDVSSDLISHLLACVVHCCLNPTTIEKKWKILFVCLFFSKRIEWNVSGTMLSDSSLETP